MKIPDLLKVLTPNLEKASILEECEAAERLLKQTVLPAYDQAVELQKTFKFKSGWHNQAEESFQSIAGKRTPLIPGIQKALANLVANLGMVHVLVGELFGDEAVAGALTYRKGHLLQFIEYASFSATYAQRLLSLLYTAETAEFSDGGVESVEDVFAPAELDWFKVNQTNFFIAINAIGKERNTLRHELESIPEMLVVPESAKSAEATFGKKLDPMGFGFIPVRLNPFWYLGKLVAEYQVARYKRAKEELSLMRVKVLNLKQLQDRKPDARIQKEIREYESIVKDLSKRIEKMEQDYA